VSLDISASPSTHSNIVSASTPVSSSKTRSTTLRGAKWPLAVSTRVTASIESDVAAASLARSLGPAYRTLAIRSSNRSSSMPQPKASRAEEGALLC